MTLAKRTNRLNTIAVLANGLLTVFAIFINFILTDSAILLIAIEAILLLYFLYRNDDSTFIFFLTCTILQNFILLIGANYISQTESNIIIILKELLVYISAIAYFFRNKQGKINLIDISFLAFCALAILNIAINRVSLSVAFSSLRQFMIPFMCYYFGKNLKIKDRARIINGIINFAIVIAIVGIIIYFFTNDSFWEALGYKEYWFNKTGSTKYSLSSFYTYDFGIRIKRFVSIFADPLAATHFLILGFLVLVYLIPKGSLNGILKILLFFALLLCFSKSVIVVVAVVVFMKLYNRTSRRINKIAYKILISLLAIVAFAALYKYSENLDAATATGNHFNSFFYGITHLSLFGGGLGSSGYNALIYTDATIEVSNEVTESFFATLTSQMGISGALFFYLFIILIVLDLYRKYKTCGQPIIYLSILLLVCITIESLVSASSISMLGTGLYFVLTGVVSNNQKNAGCIL